MEILSNGLLDLSAWALVGITLILTHITIAAVTIYLHRHQSHNALTLHPLVSHFFRFWLWLTTGMVTKEWVAIHRKHHAKCETENDPHSPQILGLNKVLLEGAELYRTESLNQETMDKYGNGTPDDWIEHHLYTGRSMMGIWLMLLINVALFGVIGITIFAVQMIWIPLFAAGVINGVGHFWGYRNFEITDASTNIVPWGILIGGEELHNNHHAHSSSARLSNKPWEFDIGWLYIRLLESLRLANVKKVAPEIVSVADKLTIDMDTVRAIIKHRAYITKLYGHKVIKPIIQLERRDASKESRRLYQRAAKFMISEHLKPDFNARELLDNVLQQSHALKTVYQFKQKLKELWQHSAANHAMRVEKLEIWCEEAKESGIQVLQEFAEELQGYTLKTA
jgi:stearoyl-CoA desaturase (delta-9 desaturase)